MEYYTIQNCKKCGTPVKLEPFDFLLNLDKEVICEKCSVEREGKKNEK